MASRMDRYQQNREERSTKNENLYRQIQEVSNYSNIEGIATIDKNNEIDITRVKTMLQNRENYQKQKQYQNLMEQEKELPEEVVSEVAEEKNYDIREVLDRAKEDRDEPNDKYRSLKNIRYDILERLNLKATPEEEQELQDLIDNIAMRNMQENGDDMGLLDDLKSNTMVGDATSIRKILDEAKEEEAKQEENKREEELSNNFNADELDKSFYTASMEFSSKDFEGLTDLREHLKTHNILLKALIVLLIVGIIVGLIVLIVKFIN